MKLSTPIFQLKRQARQLSRARGVPLHQAQALVARREGFRSWSLLAAHHATQQPTQTIRSALTPGDLVLLGARPGHGKTLLGLSLVAAWIRAGDPAAFFSLEYTARDIGKRLAVLDARISIDDRALTLDTSDDICADHIVRRLCAAPRGSLAVVDYLQLLDQNRATPALCNQVETLGAFARAQGLVIVLISQIHRSFDPSRQALPGLRDVRLPNPLDLALFSKAIFLNHGAMRVQAVS